VTDDAPSRSTRPLVALALAVVVVILLPRVPYVHWLLRPLGWLGTLVHETGHAMGAWAMGGVVSYVEVFPNGSGVAATSVGTSPWRRAVVAAGGLVGPAVASVGLLWLGLGPRIARVGLGLLGLFLLGLAAFFTKGFATPIAVGWGAVALVCAWKLSGEWARIGVLVVSVQLALHVYRKSDYLFMAEATTGAGTITSDVGQIALRLGGHYLMWGVAIGVLDVVLLGVGLLGFFFGDRLVARFQR